MCLPFHFSTEQSDQASSAVILHQVLIILLLAFQTMAIVSSYVCIYNIVVKSHSKMKSGGKSGGKTKAHMAKMLSVHIVSTLIGCIPLTIILGITLVMPSKILPIITAIVVMPANAVLNPIVYTLKLARLKGHNPCN